MHKLAKKAFTLIELLVVIATIGILSGLIVVSIGGMTEKANIAKLQVFSNSLKNSLMMNLVSEWKFDGTGVSNGGTATTEYTKDTWNGGNNCTINGTPLVYSGSNCVSDSCLQFSNTTSDYLNCGNGTSLQNITNAITVGYWIYINSYPSANYAWLVSKGKAYASSGSWTAGLITNGRGYFFIRSGDDSTYNYPDGAGWTSIPLKRWTYMTHVFNGPITYAATYQNGKIDNEKTDMLFASLYISPGYDVWIGGGQAVGRYFDGLIDDVRIYSAAIPASQIKKQYYIGLNKLLVNRGISKKEYQNRINQLAINE